MEPVLPKEETGEEKDVLICSSLQGGERGQGWRASAGDSFSNYEEECFYLYIKKIKFDLTLCKFKVYSGVK